MSRADLCAILLLGLILGCVLAFGLAQEVGPQSCLPITMEQAR